MDVQTYRVKSPLKSITDFVRTPGIALATLGLMAFVGGNIRPEEINAATSSTQVVVWGENNVRMALSSVQISQTLNSQNINANIITEVQFGPNNFVLLNIENNGLIPASEASLSQEIDSLDTNEIQLHALPNNFEIYDDDQTAPLEEDINQEYEVFNYESIDGIVAHGLGLDDTIPISATALIDGAVDPELLKTYKVTETYSFLRDDNGVIIPYKEINDKEHGTLVAAVANLAKGDKISFAACESNECQTMAILEAIKFIISHKPNARINLSFGGQDYEWNDHLVHPICVALNEVKPEQMIFAAAGNSDTSFRIPQEDGSFLIFYPAGCPLEQMIPVGAVSKYTLEKTFYSNFNEKDIFTTDPWTIKVSTPGSYIVNLGDLGSRVTSGTSSSAPSLGAIAALVNAYRVKNHLSPYTASEMKAFLARTGYCQIGYRPVGCKASLDRALIEMDIIKQLWLPIISR
jgi:hypothetical protein